MYVVGGLIVGNPGDTREKIEANLEFARRHVDWPYIQHPTPYPRTPMTRDLLARGLIINTRLQEYDGTTAVVRSEHLSRGGDRVPALAGRALDEAAPLPRGVPAQPAVLPAPRPGHDRAHVPRQLGAPGWAWRARARCSRATARSARRSGSTSRRPPGLPACPRHFVMFVRAVLRDEDDVLVAHAHLAGDVDPRLVAEAHARPELGRVALHQVRPLVAVHADAVAHAVREVLVPGPEAALLDHAPSGRVHRLASTPGRAARNAASCALRTRSHTWRWRSVGGAPNTAGARDVAGVAVQPAATVDEHHLAGAQRLGIGGAMGEGGIGPEQHQRAAAHAQALQRGRAQAGTCVCVMPSASEANTARQARTVISQARRISASSCASLIMRQPAVTGVPLVDPRAGAALRDAVGEDERPSSPRRRRARGRLAVAQDRRDQRVGRFVLLPGAHVRAERDQLLAPAPSRTRAPPRPGRPRA